MASLPALKPTLLSLIDNHNLQGLVDILQNAKPAYKWSKGKLIIHPNYSKSAEIGLIRNRIFEKYHDINPKEFSFEVRALGWKVVLRLVDLSLEARKLYKEASIWESTKGQDKYSAGDIPHPFRIFDSSSNFKQLFPNQTVDKVVSTFQMKQIVDAYDNGFRNVTASNKSTPQRDAAIKADADALKADFLRANATGRIYQQSRSNYTAPTSPYTLVATPNGIESRMDAIGQGWLVPGRSDYR